MTAGTGAPGRLAAAGLVLAVGCLGGETDRPDWPGYNVSVALDREPASCTERTGVPFGC